HRSGGRDSNAPSAARTLYASATWTRPRGSSTYQFLMQPSGDRTEDTKHRSSHQVGRTAGRQSCRHASSPATPTSGITAEMTKTAPSPDTAAIWPETNEPVMTPKSVKAQNVAIAVPR